MSDATQPSQKSGNSRRRRSRGGNNRNRSNNNQRGPRGPKSNRSGGPRKRPRKPELTFWQKLLKAIGLYKEPTRASGTKSKSKSSRQPKSNTRNARSDDPKPKKSNKRSRGGDPSTVESSRVYVGNLSYDVTEQDLDELFKGVGPVRSAEIVYNRNTHRSKGYGFVEMLHQDDAVRCVEVLNDQPFMGRNLIVSGAKSKGADDQNDEQEPQATIKAKDIELAPLPDEAPAASKEEEASAESEDTAEEKKSAEV